METAHGILLVRQFAEFSYIGIFLIGFLANVFIPVPEEIVMLGIGYIVGTGKILFLPTVIVVIIGALLSDLLMYELSFRGNRFITTIHDKYFSKLIPFRSEFIQLHLKKIIFATRFLVQMRFFGPFFAGQYKMDRKTFMEIDTLALILYTLIYIGAGVYFQNRIERIVDGIGIVKNVILIIVGIVICISIIKGLRTLALRYFTKSSNE